MPRICERGRLSPNVLFTSFMSHVGLAIINAVNPQFFHHILRYCVYFMISICGLDTNRFVYEKNTPYFFPLLPTVCVKYGKICKHYTTKCIIIGIILYIWIKWRFWNIYKIGMIRLIDLYILELGMISNPQTKKKKKKINY